MLFLLLFKQFFIDLILTFHLGLDMVACLPPPLIASADLGFLQVLITFSQVLLHPLPYVYIGAAINCIQVVHAG